MGKKNDQKTVDPEQLQDDPEQLQEGTDSFKDEPPVEKEPEREDIFIPRALDGEERSLFVSVNSVNYLLPKGKTSNVPREVAAEIRRSWAAQNDWDDMSSELAEVKQSN